MITATTQDAVTRIAIDDGKLNVFTLDAAQALNAQIQGSLADQSVKCIVIEGNERSFSAGLDLATLRRDDADSKLLLATMGSILKALYGSRLRVVSICTGHAAAAGAMLLLVSDFRIASTESAKIGFSEVANGLPVPEMPIRLVRDRINPKYHSAVLALSQMYRPQEAVEVGFLDEAVADYAAAAARVEIVVQGLSQLDDAAYLETISVLRKATLDAAR